jgi:hypothetical protein
MSRFVSSVIGDRFKDNVLESARLYAMVGNALANAAFVAYATKFKVS